MTITISKSLKNIGKYAFNECNNLTVVLPEGLTNIKKELFCGSEVRRVRVAASVQSIGEKSFYKCKELQNVIFSENSQLKEIGKDVFNECCNLILMLPEGLTNIGEDWFKGSGIKEVYIPVSM